MPKDFVLVFYTSELVYFKAESSLKSKEVPGKKVNHINPFPVKDK